MKRLLYILFLTFHLNSIFANESIEYPALDSLPKVHLDTSLSPDKYSYVTLGSSVLLQQVGLGRRYRNLETLKGHDISLNAHFSLFLLSEIKRSKFPLYPSIKYTYLNYRNNSPTSPYFGVACEGAFVIDSHYYRSLSRSVGFIPNIGLIWGRERENMRFTQLQLNVIPAIGFVVGTGLLLFGSNKGGLITDRQAGAIIALGSASVLFSYSAGF